ncbi:MATE family efflux transporter [Paramuribaculum intestinale]|uniref:Multidrug export protein MepA n=2 Tax=Paramuribaculum intestinale TaxID=2094151 RepID=A0A2V1J1M1_9BACT|nr:MATE family efflux transporter [Paramuribaculum intestinale]PWB09410.1 MATE family efflux transporter [Paramuribaculum intestinale]
MEHDTPTEGNLDRLATGSIARLLWRYSLPAVVGMVVTSLYNVIDRIFIGQGVGTEAIAGLAITFPVMNVSTAIGVLIGAGASARVSIMLGASDRRGAQLVLGNALVLIVVNALVYLTLFRIFLDDILLAFGASPATLPYARDFMVCLLPGMMVMNISFSFNNIMRASGYPARAMLTMFIGAGINVILDPIFIFVFDWGIKGAAIATDIAMTCSMIFVMAHFMRRDSTLRFTRGIYRLRWRIIAGIISIGAAPSLVNLAGSAINVIVNTSLYTHGSDNAVAASGIFTTYTSLLVMVVVGLCQGMQPILGYNYGAGLYGRLKRCYWLATGAATAIVTAGCAFGLLWPGLIARAFTTDPTLIAVTSRALSLSLLAFWAVGFQIVATTFFQSIGKAGKSIFLSLTRQVIFLIPLLLTLPDRLGLDGVWLSFPSSDVMATIVTALMITFQLRRLPAAPLPCFAGTKATK